jgi:MerR family transcriptional regulator, mercuric resistance operon regulatory protein
MTTNSLTIGRLAHMANVNVETVRYYLRRGLIAEPEKPYYGFREYPLETVARIQFIKRAQRLGFTLKEVAQLLSFGERHCDEVLELAEHKCAWIDIQIKELSAMKNVLEQLLKDCHSNRDAPCPIVESLVGHNYSDD